MTIVEKLKQIIDEKIRQKTAAGSIEKDDVADSFDAIVEALYTASNLQVIRSGNEVTVNDGVKTVLVIFDAPLAGDFTLTMPANPVNGDELVIRFLNNSRIEGFFYIKPNGAQKLDKTFQALPFHFGIENPPNDGNYILIMDFYPVSFDDTPITTFDLQNEIIVTLVYWLPGDGGDGFNNVTTVKYKPATNDVTALMPALETFIKNKIAELGGFSNTSVSIVDGKLRVIVAVPAEGQREQSMTSFGISVNPGVYNVPGNEGVNTTFHYLEDGNTWYREGN